MIWLSGILALAIFSSPAIFGMESAQQDSIENLYKKNYWKMRQMYEDLAQQNSSVASICQEASKTIPELEKSKDVTILSDVIMGEQNYKKFSLTLDGINYFPIPAVLKCTPKRNNKLFKSYYLLIVQLTEKNMEALKLYEESDEFNQISFQTDDVEEIRILYETYTTFHSNMKEWYEKNEDMKKISGICKDTDSSKKVLKEKLILGDFILQLTQHNGVNLPAVVQCKVEEKVKDKKRISTLYYVIDHTDFALHEVYYNSATKLKSKETYVLEKHLVKKTF